MKIFRPIFTILLCLLFATSGQAYAETGHDAHSGHGPAKLSLDHGKRWPTDAPLRKSMKTLRTAFAERLHAIHKGDLSAAEYKILGEMTGKEIGNIVAQCKLVPEADAMLHLVIADMMAGADIMIGNANGKPRTGAHKVVSALNNYGRYFDHPRWADLH